MIFKPKEKGQGLVEYALILVLVSIVVIAALMILGPIIGGVFDQSAPAATAVPDTRNETLLADAPRIKQGYNHPYRVAADSDGVTTEFGFGCSPLTVNSGFDVKIGTAVPYLDDITITREGDTYTVCNNIPGTHILVYVTYLPELR